jgi:molybdate transport system regulatory protein
MGTLKIKSKIWLEKGDELIFGFGRASILKAVHETGSINQAAEKLGMSYRRIWSYIHAAESRLKRPLLKKNKGGKSGGGAVLTDYAKLLLEKFEHLDRDVREYTNRRFKETF